MSQYVSETTEGLEVAARAEYIPDQSDPTKNYYFFAYHIVIRNRGQESVQLISRHWTITDGKGQIEEVRGEGVVGEQPILDPGGHFEYTSACPLKTPIGSMIGEYILKKPSGETFMAQIPEFHLIQPESISLFH